MVAAAVIVIGITQWWTGFLAIPATPHYAAVFSWFSTFGGFALAVIYLLMSVGALRGLRDHERPWAVWVAALVGIVVTAGAIFGAVYKVTAPAIYAPYTAAAIFVIGLVVAFARVGRGKSPAAPVDSVAAAEAGR